MHQISRKTGYKIVAKHEALGWAALNDASRSPRSGSHWHDSDTINVVLATRLEFPEWGAEKVIDYLRGQEPDRTWPAPSVAHTWIDRAGLVEHKVKARRYPHPGKPPAVELIQPNQQWSVDFKGHFRTKDRRYCYPLTVLDSYSRYLLGCEGLLTPSFDLAWPVFERIFREYGLPDSILSDNGSPFATNSVKRLSRLSVRWIRLGITPRLIQPGKPQQNGRHERMHRDLKKVACADAAPDCSQQQVKFDGYQHRHNHLRPHDALAKQTPARQYEPSLRRYPKKLPQVEYPAEFQVRRVRHNGEIRWKGSTLFLSEALAKEPVGLERITDGIWIIRFGTIELGYYSEREKKLHLDKDRPDGKAEN
jgi:transposase InsO family protein